MGERRWGLDPPAPCGGHPTGRKPDWQQDERDREAAARELYAALKPGGILSVTEIFGDPDYRRPAPVRREVEPAGFELVERFGGFPAYTLNFRRPENLVME